MIHVTEPFSILKNSADPPLNEDKSSETHGSCVTTILDPLKNMEFMPVINCLVSVSRLSQLAIIGSSFKTDLLTIFAVCRVLVYSLVYTALNRS